MSISEWVIQSFNYSVFIQYSVFNVQLSTFNVQYSILQTTDRYSTKNIEYRIHSLYSVPSIFYVLSYYSISYFKGIAQYKIERVQIKHPWCKILYYNNTFNRYTVLDTMCICICVVLCIYYISYSVQHKTYRHSETNNI